jgi:hypothetical protein
VGDATRTRTESDASLTGATAVSRTAFRAATVLDERGLRNLPASAPEAVAVSDHRFRLKYEPEMAK